MTVRANLDSYRFKHYTTAFEAEWPVFPNATEAAADVGAGRKHFDELGVDRTRDAIAGAIHDAVRGREDEAEVEINAHAWSCIKEEVVKVLTDRGFTLRVEEPYVRVENYRFGAEVNSETFDGSVTLTISW